MLTSGDQEQPFDVRKGTSFDIQNAAPLHLGGGVIAVFAGDRAGLTTNTAVKINCHAPAGNVALFNVARWLGHVFGLGAFANTDSYDV